MTFPPVSALDIFADVSEFTTFARSKGLRFHLVSTSVQDLIFQEAARLSAKSAASSPLAWFDEYHTYNDTKAWYLDLSRQFPQLATFVPTVGKTWENRDLFAFRITANPNPSRPKIWVQCNIHAREWITSATCQYAFHHILNNYGVDQAVTELLNSAEFVVIPFVNPDGYDFTWSNDRLWRKNRRNNGGSYGVDLNRNYDVQWGGVGSSPLPSSDTYHGPGPNSEPEVQSLVAYFSSLSNVIASLDVHSYSQLILRPYTHIAAASANEADLKQVSDEMVSIILGVHGKRFTPGPWYSALYPSSGVSQDYYYAHGSPFSLTIELRPTTAVPGFVLPPDEIIPSGEEVTPALLHYAQFALNSNLRKQN